MARPGKPRNAATRGERRRRRAQRAKLVDQGTAEQIGRRRALIGSADRRLAGDPLGVLYARRVISADLYTAGQKLYWLRCVSAGLPYPSGGLCDSFVAESGGADKEDGPAACSGDDRHDMRLSRQAEYDEALRRLAAVSRQAKIDVVQLCCFQKWPAWIRVEPIGPDCGDSAGVTVTDRAAAAQCLAGLEAVAKVFGMAGAVGNGR